MAVARPNPMGRIRVWDVVLAPGFIFLAEVAALQVLPMFSDIAAPSPTYRCWRIK